MKLALSRLDWTHRYIDQFDSAVDAFLQLNPYQIIIDKEDKGKDEFLSRYFISYRFKVVSNPPQELRFLAGDIVHNLRCTVNNLLWSVWKSNGGKRNLSLEFKNTLNHFDTAIEKKFQIRKLLPSPILTWYEGEQIYNRKDGKPSLLNMVNIIWNDDKHKVPVLLGSAIRGASRPRLSGIGSVATGHFPLSDLRDGDVILTYDVSASDKFHFDPQNTFSVDVALKGGSGPARRFLRRVENHIRTDVLPKFEPFLT